MDKIKCKSKYEYRLGKKKKVPEFAVLFFVVVWVMSYAFISCEADHPPKVPVKEVTEIWSCPLLVFG